jgi:hypothetical protein
LSTLTSAKLKQHLAGLSREALEADIVSLFNGIPTVKDFYQQRLLGDVTGDVLAKYKQRLRGCFFSKAGNPKLSLTDARKVVNEYRKITPSPHDEADLMLCHVENGIDFTNAFGDIDEPFYVSIERMYEAACQHIAEHDLGNTFNMRCAMIVSNTSHIGWGFHDTLGEIYERYFEA